jgi:hexokinase
MKNKCNQKNMPFSVTFSYYVEADKVWKEKVVKMAKNSDLFKLADHYANLLKKLGIKHTVELKETKV